MKKIASGLLVASTLVTIHTAQAKRIAPVDDGSTTIEVALLLDTSNSMDGLIEQAKSRLWNIVNTLTTLKYNGKTPTIKIALYEYGNNGLSQKDNWVRQAMPLTQDLDSISEKLFALRTNGGNEYVGAAITDASAQLKWSGARNSMKLIYVAGNESFKQGSVDYREAISDARSKDIYINTIYCGDAAQGINEFWKDGAQLGGGQYFSIDSDKKIQYIETPYDEKISQLNGKLNNTYYGYGRSGSTSKLKQSNQDENAAALAPSVSVDRAVTKSKNSAYSNSDWDVVDRYKKDKNFISQADDSALPAELKGKSEREKVAFIEAKTAERESIQTEIGKLAVQRQDYIDAQAKLSQGADDLGKKNKKSIFKIAEKKGFSQANR